MSTSQRELSRSCFTLQLASAGASARGALGAVWVGVALLGSGCAGEAGELFPGVNAGAPGGREGPALGLGGTGITGRGSGEGPSSAGASSMAGQGLGRAGAGGAPPGVGVGGGASPAGGAGGAAAAEGGAPGGEVAPVAAGGGSGLAGGGSGPDEGEGGAASVSPGPVCDPCPCSEGPFGEPELVLGLGLDLPSFGPAPSADGLSLLFSAIGETEDIFAATRTDRGPRFSAAARVPGLSGDATEEGTPFLSADGREAYFFSTRPGVGTLGGRDLWVAEATGDGFSAPVVVPRVNHEGLDHLPRLSADGLTLMFVSGRDAATLASNIWVAERPSLDAPFGEPIELAGVNSDAREEGFWLAEDGLSLYFASNREADDDDMDIFVATRPELESPFEGAQRLGVVNTPGIEIDPALTADGFELFFASDRSGTMQLYRSARRCP